VGLCALLRFFVVIFAMHFGGALHALADLWAHHDDAAAATEDDGCPDDESGSPCPPGCPTCHCAHPQLPVSPAVARGVFAAPFEAAALAVRAETRPESPPIRSLFRPPRA